MLKNPSAADLQRERWDTWDPMLISEGLFSAANIFSSLKLVYIFSVCIVVFLHHVDFYSALIGHKLPIFVLMCLKHNELKINKNK